MVGTIIIAVVGYGMALLFVVSLVGDLRKALEAQRAGDHDKSGTLAVYAGCDALAAMVFAGVTRWAVGGLI